MHRNLSALVGLTLFSLAGCSATNPSNTRTVEFTRPLASATTAAPSVNARQPRPAQSVPTPSRSHLFVSVGRRSMDDDLAWNGLEHPISFGVEGDIRSADSPVGAEFGFLLGAESDEVGPADITSVFLEVYGGVRLTGDLGSQKRLHPYVGAGATVLFVDVTSEIGSTETSDDDATLGGYVHGGMYFDINRHFAIGVDGRLVFATDINLAGVNTDADYSQLALTFGFGF